MAFTDFSRCVVSVALLFGAPAFAGMAEAPTGCAPDGSTRYICDVVNAEDMVELPGSDAILAGNLVGRQPQGRGGFYLIDASSGSRRSLVPDFSGPVDPRYAGCEGPPPADRFGAHGISVRRLSSRRYHVLAVNHGGRESVESFEFDLTGAEPVMRWQGCVIVRSAVTANAVAHVGPDGLVVTSFGDRSDKDSFRKLGAGEATGFAEHWTLAGGWTRLEGSALVGTNGVAASRDGKTVYLTGWGDSSLHLVSVSGGAAPRRVALPDMRADNIRIDADGAMIVAGQRASPADVLACSARRPQPCLLPYRVVRIDPETLIPTLWLDADPSATFGAASVAIRRKDELWIGTFQSDRIARVPLRRH